MDIIHPFMPDNLYTKQTADALLPEIRRRLQQMREALQEAATHAEKVGPRVEGNGADEHPGAWMKATRTLEENHRWFLERDIILRDVRDGIIDLPSVRDGEEILLCWKDGEAEIGFWHHPDTGFASRRPL